MELNTIIYEKLRIQIS